MSPRSNNIDWGTWKLSTTPRQSLSPDFVPKHIHLDLQSHEAHLPDLRWKSGDQPIEFGIDLLPPFHEFNVGLDATRKSIASAFSLYECLTKI